MADHITDERLRFQATRSKVAWVGVAGDELGAIASELLAARKRITQLEQEPPMALVDFGYGLDLQGIRDDLKFLDDVRKENERLQGMIDDIESETGHSHFLNDEQHEPPHLPDHVRGIVKERDAARAQLHADDQRAWEALGRPEGTYETTNVQRLCAEVERLRADLREAVALLRAYGQPHYWVGLKDAIDWNTRWRKLLAKHKETP